MVNYRKIHMPLSEEDARALAVGDSVLLSGSIVTGRDRVHQYLFNERPDPGSLPFSLSGSLIYHCGPIVKEESGAYRMIACGPTTSARMDMYEWWLIEQYGVRAIMGKGGMGAKTAAALQRCGAVYLHTIGGAAVYLAGRVRKVVDVWQLAEFGMAEAMWLLQVEDFPAIVTMDAKGNSLHEYIEKDSKRILDRLIGSSERF